MRTIAIFLTPNVEHGTALLERLANPDATLLPVRHNIQEAVPTAPPLTTDELAFTYVQQALEVHHAIHPPNDVVIVKARMEGHIMGATYLGMKALDIPRDTHAQKVLPILFEALHYKLVKLESHVHYITLPRYAYETLLIDTNMLPTQHLEKLIAEADPQPVQHLTILHTTPNTTPNTTLHIPPQSLMPLSSYTNILPRKPPYNIKIVMTQQQYDTMQAIRIGVPEGPTNSLNLAFEWLIQQTPLFKQYIDIYTQSRTTTTTQEDEQELWLVPWLTL